MAISESHFKTAVAVPSSTPKQDLPVELLAGAVGVLLVFLIVFAFIFMRMQRAGQEPPN